MLTDRELQEHDEAAARRVRDAEFLKAHPEYVAPQRWRDLGQLIAEDPNVDPALRAFFKLRDDKHNARKFSAAPVAITGMGDLA